MWIFETWQQVFTVGTVVLLIIALATNKIGVDTAMVGALTLLMLIGIIEPVDAVASFAHPAVVLIGALFVVAEGLVQTGAVERVATPLLGRPKRLAAAQVRMMAPVALMSAFMNNTPIVAMFMPIVNDWARKLRMSSSKLLMPLSFAAILGGACTLIGTSTNVALTELYVEYTKAHEHELAALHLTTPSPLKQMWWMSVVGVPVMIIGIGYVIMASKWLLPGRISAGESRLDARQYKVEMVVQPTSPIVGKSIEAAGLRHLPGLYLSEIERDDIVIPAVSPETIIEANDRLVFVGVLESVIDLRKIRGLEPATDQVKKVEGERGARTLVEAVVSNTSPLVGKTVRESRFRTVYNAAIIAVHRNGYQIKRKIGDIILQSGDTLLLDTHAGFLQAYRNSQHFYLVSQVENSQAPRHERAWIAISIMALFVLLLTVPAAPIIRFMNARTGWSLPEIQLQPLQIAFLCAMMMVVLRCCTGTTARRAINWQVLLAIGAALGIGKAMTDTGAARVLAERAMQLVGGIGPHGLLLSLFLLTSFFAQLITNKAAAVLMFPITVAVAADLGVSPEPFVIGLMMASACSFMTPIGFPTNLMVYGPGGYRFVDFVRLGLPLTVVVGVVTTVLAPLFYPFSP